MRILPVLNELLRQEHLAQKQGSTFYKKAAKLAKEIASELTGPSEREELQVFLYYCYIEAAYNKNPDTSRQLVEYVIYHLGYSDLDELFLDPKVIFGDVFKRK